MSRTLIIISISFFLVQCGCNHDKNDISYSEQIKPILNKKCLRCHGGIRKQSGFSLLFQEEAFAKAESGAHAMVPGKAKESEMIRRIRSEDPELRMPQEGPPCTIAEIKLLEQWIDQGAKWDTHWSYTTLSEHESPTAQSEWARTDFDHYVENKLLELGLSPNEMASPNQLARRVSLDITGLPPEPNQVSAYLSSPSEHQYQNMLEQLLASPHYGERMASMWLDLARYADSKGYEKDAHRSIWRYRDWLINAFNQDLPFDQFTKDQLAGDLIENGTKDQLIATAFHRNTMTNDEGGTEDEEYRSAAIIDRVNTTFEVWQGTTIGCVQCHSHPYDPIRHEEYYQLFALFNTTQDADIGNEYPYLFESKDSIHEAEVNEVAQWIRSQRNITHELSAVTREEIKQLIFPRLQADLADDHREILIHEDGAFRNSAMNANNQKDKTYYLLYENVPMDGLSSIHYHYHSKGDDVAVKVYLDSIGGRLVSQAELQNTKDAIDLFNWASINTESFVGNHDLIFHIINTSGDFLTGVALFKEIELGYGEARVSKLMRKQQDRLLKIYRQGIQTPIMREQSELFSRKTHVFERGNYLTKGREVSPGVPNIFNPKKALVENRLQLADWLVSRENPLTSRVIVNRIWEMFFGHGIVETLEDFGTQGIEPTHQKVLDVLADKFSGEWNWSLKRLVKEILSSATYRQSSTTSDEKLMLDPFNYNLSRGARMRLSAEQIRDQALSISGLLSRKIGGPSVMPPQPDRVWQVVYSNAKWIEAEGEDRYRRGLYTYWKRTTPYPSMIAFDSPSREFCVSRRIRTNTPLQALVTLNDTVYLEAAFALAKWMAHEANGNVDVAITRGYERALLVKPDQETLNILKSLYNEAVVPKAQMVSSETEAPANDYSLEIIKPLSVVANAIMNLDAFLTKG